MWGSFNYPLLFLGENDEVRASRHATTYALCTILQSLIHPQAWVLNNISCLIAACQSLYVSVGVGQIWVHTGLAHIKTDPHTIRWILAKSTVHKLTLEPCAYPFVQDVYNVTILVEGQLSALISSVPSAGHCQCWSPGHWSPVHWSPGHCQSWSALFETLPALISAVPRVASNWGLPSPALMGYCWLCWSHWSSLNNPPYPLQDYILLSDSRPRWNEKARVHETSTNPYTSSQKQSASGRGQLWHPGLRPVSILYAPRQGLRSFQRSMAPLCWIRVPFSKRSADHHRPLSLLACSHHGCTVIPFSCCALHTHTWPSTHTAGAGARKGQVSADLWSFCDDAWRCDTSDEIVCKMMIRWCGHVDLLMRLWVAKCYFQFNTQDVSK